MRSKNETKPKEWQDQHDRRFLTVLNHSSRTWLAVLGKFGLVLFLLFSFILIDILIIEPNNLTLTENTFDILDGDHNIKIVFFSDIHIGQQRPGYLEEIVAKVNAQNPDIILVGGDNIDSRESELAGLEPLKGLRPKYGTFAVLGNHDYGKWGIGFPTELGDKVASKLDGLNITVLRNENQVLDINGTKIAIIGLDDEWMGLNDYKKASSGLNNIPKIIVVHNQFAVNEVEVDKNSILLSGHTHCGQIRVPFVTDAILGPMFGKLGGIYEYGDGKLYVSCGVTSGKVRFLAPPEISIIWLE